MACRAATSVGSSGPTSTDGLGSAGDLLGVRPLLCVGREGAARASWLNVGGWPCRSASTIGTQLTAACGPLAANGLVGRERSGAVWSEGRESLMRARNICVIGIHKRHCL